MKKILILLFSLVSLTGYAQTSTFGGIGLRVNDTTTYQTNAATLHSLGYYDIYFNNQATNDHWDVWNGSSYDHIFSFGSGGSGGSLNTLAPNIQTGATYTVQASDTTNIIYSRRTTTPQDITLAPGLKVGSTFVIVPDSTQTPTFTAGAGVDIIDDKEAIVYHIRETNKYVRLGSSGGGTPGGADTQVQYNDAGSFNGEADFAYNETTNTLTVDNAAVDTEVYDATGWNGDLTVPTKDAVRDKIETMAGTPAGANTQVQYNASGSFGAEAAFTYDASGNILDADNITVDDEAYDATNWNGSLEVPTKNAVRDQIQTITATDYSRNAVAVSAGTLTLDMNSLALKNFDLTATQSSGFTIAFSNTTNMVEAKLTLRLTGSVAITMPAGVEMQNYETINTRWNTSTNVLTLVGATATRFLITFYYDGTVLLTQASDSFE